ncbi:52 kDa repressor of the inhibitor of the protein kinase-like isoform X2 [Dermacentor albipictus]|uniref:52 kDa repressor of the inhibitor of the protein kinase-like isoform X2 n=1 Tax=Dermacentor albipictus TaxID=60249 RepID=UPI0038FCB09C
MPNKCCVPGCYYQGRKKVQVFSFPKEENLRQKWISAISKKDFVPTKYTKVCADHFHSSCLERTTTYTDPRTGQVLEAALPVPRLRSGSVPTIFPTCPSYTLKQRENTTETSEARVTGIEAAKFADGVDKRRCFATPELKVPHQQQSVKSIQQPAAGASSAPSPQIVHIRAHHTQSGKSCQTSDRPIALDQGADNDRLGTVWMNVESGELLAMTSSPPETESARGACGHKSLAKKVKTTRFNQSCAVIGCGNNHETRWRLMKEWCYKHKVLRGKCRCGVYDFHRFPSYRKWRDKWIAALRLPDDEFINSSWVCSEHFVRGRPTFTHPVPTLDLGYSYGGVEIQMPRKTLGTSCWTRDVSTQKDVPLTCAVVCQTESLTGWLRDNSTQWERPYEHVHVEHSYADMKWLQEYTSLKGLFACRTKGKV